MSGTGIKIGRALRAAVATIGLVSCAQAATPAVATTGSASAPNLQACVQRWNWMHYREYFTQGVARARVQAKPCRVEIALTRSNFFPCSVNQAGAFGCAEHAVGTLTAGRLKRYNARYFPRTGSIRLDHPPARPVSLRKPDWVRRFPVVWGFVVPFDRDGRLRPGLMLLGRASSGPGTTCTIPLGSKHERYWLEFYPEPYGCGAGLYCFGPPLRPPAARRLACPLGRGATTFRRALLGTWP